MQTVEETVFLQRDSSPLLLHSRWDSIERCVSGRGRILPDTGPKLRDQFSGCFA